MYKRQVLFARVSDWPQRPFAATMQPFFATCSTISIAVKVSGGLSLPEGWPLWLILCICVISVGLGEHIGAMLSLHLSPRAARNTALTIASIGAVVACVTGISSLIGS